MMQIYLDESGDLGFSFEKEYRNGGSSRYLTLAFVFVPYELRKIPKNLIVSLYEKYKWQNEKKASTASINQKKVFSNKVVELLKLYPTIKIDVITVMKSNVQEHIRRDPNKLYNFMVKLVVPEYIKSSDCVQFIPDERSVKVKSGNSLADYLQTILWFDCNCKTRIINMPTNSAANYNVQFADWIANSVAIHFEDNISEPFQIIKPFIKSRCLYFNN